MDKKICPVKRTLFDIGRCFINNAIKKIFSKAICSILQTHHTFVQILLVLLLIIPMNIKILLFVLFSSLSVIDSSPICDFCHSVVKMIQQSAPKKPLIPFVQIIAYQYCVRKHLQDKKVCRGATKEMTKYILTSLWRHHTNPHIICQNMKLCKNQYIKRDLKDDINRILSNKPEKEWQKATQRRILKLMHISDLHPDLFYTPGAPVVCTEPVCCRHNVTAKDNNTKKAGYWGSLGQCDVPMQTFDIFLKQLNKLEIDAIVWTGDNTPHDIWQQSQSYNLNFTIMLSQKIRSATNITVIPSMGNHESYPVNVYDFNSKERESVLNRGLAQAWRYWLDDNAKKMQAEKGYYSMVYPHLNNAKILSINTQAGNNQNWVLLEDPSDPGEQLKWIQKELLQSESKSQIVYITGHIPPKSNLNEWSMRFNALVDRFSYIIRGQLYGHTHSDQLSFHPKMKNMSNIKNATLSNYYLVAPAMTTSTYKLPGYRILDIDFDTLQILDYSQYRLDLRKYQTADQTPQYQLYYKFKEAWKINDMTISGGMTELRNKLRDSPEMQKLYEQHKCAGVCDGTSGISIFCSTTTSHQYESQCLGTNMTKSAFQKAAGPWKQITHKQ